MLHHASRTLLLRLSLGGAVLGAVGAATLTELQPAVAASFIAGVNSAVTCATSTACVTGTNTKSGAGVSGTGKNGPGMSGTSSYGNGVAAASTNGNGIFAESTHGYGIYAESSDTVGVDGASATTYGVVGTSVGKHSGVAGVFGLGLTGVLGSGLGQDGTGVEGNTATGYGVYGDSSSSGFGVVGYSGTGSGVNAESASGTALLAYAHAGIAIRADTFGSNFSVVGVSDTLEGNGADFEGGRFGIIGRALPSGFPLVLTDSSGKNVFYVNGTGDVYSTGNFYTLARTRNGATLSSFTARSTEPTVEDSGSAQLTAGFAAVRLDPNFAAAVDTSASYRVFITPDGDTRGLFVAQKTARGFTVRETQGGRSNLAFDYRIVATSQGEVGKRMAVTSLSAAPNPPAASPFKPLRIKVRQSSAAAKR
jgi:hypothetical protein